MEIKVLALNDDNHEICFATMDYVYYSARDFMESCLCKPHGDTYVIRGIHICEPPESFEHLSDDEWISVFDLVEQKPVNLFGCGRGEDVMKRIAHFEKLWKEGNKYW